METATEKTQGKNGAGNPKVANMKEVSAMRFGERIFKVKAPVKILVGLAAGAMLIGGTAFIYQEINQGKVGSLPSSSETTQAFQAHLVSQYYDAQEMELDALSESFIGVPASWNNETIQAFQPSAYWAQRDEAEEMMLQEVRHALIGKPVSSQRMKAFASVAELESLYPDTPYYRDPDWREGQMQSTGR